MELRLGMALSNHANGHQDCSPEDIDLDLNMGIGGGRLYVPDAADRVPRQPQQGRHLNHPQLFCRYAEYEQRSGQMRTLPLLHGYKDSDTDGSSRRQPSTDNREKTWSPSPWNSTYVKVTMEGVGIGRKVDLSLHHSLQDLMHTLLPMFGIYNGDSDNYQLSYLDRGGHWVVAQDSSWRDIIRSTQRLKIVKV
ncbi:hypothetical protein MLD38_014980 [Melastoma candidum]|uniref:Uncharacterized protein n=1 Tax=Melastoma candidum TaxID=119954 RepID=A0ACB9REL2_9MYRT|nr:hypothetical protein MLD38_014980 [Melastoma candidum]